MSQPVIRWGQVKKYFLSRGYEITKSGGDTLISAPKNINKSGRTRNIVRIGHKCSSKDGDDVWDSYLSLIKRAFNITRDQIIKG